MSKYYYHGLKEGIQLINHIVCVDKMIEILSSGGLKSRTKLGQTSSYGFNGNDYISLCKKLSMDEYIKNPSQAFFICIFNNYCFIISDEIESVKTKTISKEDYNDWYDVKIMIEENPNERISDLVDEWQVKDEIPLKYIVGIGFPFKEVEYLKTQSDEHKEKIEKLMNIANTLGLDIVDTRSMEFVEEYESKKERNPKIKKFSMYHMED